MSDAIRRELGPDLASLLDDCAADIVTIEPITSLPSARSPRTSFRVEFADGSMVKARRVESPTQAERMEHLSTLLRPEWGPRVRARRGSALLVEWIVGSPVDDRAVTHTAIRESGGLLGNVHRVSVPDGLDIGGCTVDGWVPRLRAGLDALTGCGALDDSDAARAMDLALGVRPDRSHRGLIHGDFCPENLVVSEDGRTMLVDLENIAVDEQPFELARTWYRWSMAPDQFRMFLAAYGRPDVVEDFRRSAAFWGIGALAEAAAFRVTRGTADVDVPLDRLRSLLRGDRASWGGLWPGAD
jgi:aminoglycoside phosphotransferase (APT) family kinase protein